MSTLPIWIQIVIPLIGGGFFGAIAGIISSTIKYKQQIRQLEIRYSQTLNDNFLLNSRQQMDTIYIPLNKSLTRLADSFELYHNRMKTDEANGVEQVFENNVEEDLDKFISDCKDFEKLMKEITNQGYDMHLDKDFEERLRSFSQLLDEAMRYPRVIYSAYGKNDFPIRFSSDIRYFKSYIKQITLGTRLPQKVIDK